MARRAFKAAAFRQRSTFFDPSAGKLQFALVKSVDGTDFKYTAAEICRPGRAVDHNSLKDFSLTPLVNPERQRVDQ